MTFAGQFDTERLREVAEAQQQNTLMEYCRTHPELTAAVKANALDDYFSNPTEARSNLPAALASKLKPPTTRPTAATPAPAHAAKPANAPPPRRNAKTATPCIYAGPIRRQPPAQKAGDERRRPGPA
jgi:hypothetical protein